ncbi:MAG TPA: TetR/AcrR family transcriptional regulator [Pseudonocardiaceae bacterium]|jgi:AcrR family transcriptional regulator|nr:TetR/AcrR family transcriptional regulator [Pseudonocardiaceae bacterium]
MSRSTSDGLPTAGSTLDRVLASAARLFREKGYAGTSTRELAASAGLQSASLYHHIGTKEDLLHRLSMRTLQEVAELFDRVVAEEADPVPALERLVRSYVELLLTERDRHAATLHEVRALSEHRRAEVVALSERNVTVVRDTVLRAQRAGGLRADIDPRYATLALFNMLNWTIFWYDPDGALDPPAIGELLWSVLFRGLRPDSVPSGR